MTNGDLMCDAFCWSCNYVCDVAERSHSIFIFILEKKHSLP